MTGALTTDPPRRATDAGEQPTPGELTWRARLTAVLIAASPLHIGQAENVEPDPDRQSVPKLRVLRSADGRPFLPGTSLAGVFSSWYERHIPSGDRNVVFGSPQRGSRLVIDDASHLNPAGADQPSLWRHSVGIDRYRGAAAETYLFAREALPPGSRFALTVTAVDDDEFGPAISALWLLADALERGAIRVGAATSRGLGRLTLASPARVDTADLAALPGLLHWLSGDPHPDRPTSYTALHQAGLDTRLPTVTAPPSIDITVQFTATSPVLVAFEHLAQWATPGDTQSNATAIPVLEPPPPDLNDPAGPVAGPAADPQWRPVIPGSSIKGALRSRAARIAHTVLTGTGTGAGDAAASTRGMALNDQLAAEPDLVHRLFGSTERRAALTVHDVYATSGIPAGTARALRVPGGTVDELVIDALGYPSTQVAIDRWTGSAASDRPPTTRGEQPDTPDTADTTVGPARRASGALFRVLPPQRVTGWQPITVSVDWARLGDDDTHRDAALALLGLVLAELVAGTLPLGGKTTRGLGHIRCTGIRVAVTGETGTDWSGTHQLPDAAGLLAFLRDTCRPGWAEVLREDATRRAGTATVNVTEAT